MLVAVHALDTPDSEAVRRQSYEAHKAHLLRASEYGVKLVIGGPLLRGDDASPVGSLMVFEAQSCASVERFNADDPFILERVWHTVHISRFDRKT